VEQSYRQSLHGYTHQYQNQALQNPWQNSENYQKADLEKGKSLVVPVVRVELTCLAAVDFESTASTISPHRLDTALQRVGAVYHSHSEDSILVFYFIWFRHGQERPLETAQVREGP
jgi:hypothetical protein